MKNNYFFKQLGFALLLSVWVVGMVSAKGSYGDKDPNQKMMADCNINAGGSQKYCFDEKIISLYGSQVGIDTNTINWTNINAPAGVTTSILTPSSLTTDVTASPGFSPGTYQFVITGTCDGGSPVKSDTVTIEVMPAVTPAQIYDNTGSIITTDPFVVCRNLELIGSSITTNETSYWSSLTNPGGHNTSTSGDTLNASLSHSYGCTNVTYVYTTTNGGCTDHDTLNVKYERQSDNIVIYGGDRNICADTFRLQGSPTGCDAVATWSISTLNGGTGSLITTYGATNYLADFEVPPGGGTYQIIYTVPATAACPGGSDTVTINVCYSNAVDLGNSYTKYVCDQYPDTFYLGANVSTYYTYGDWYQSGGGGSPAPTVVQTGTGQAYALISDQNVNQYCFRINAVGDSCTFYDSSDVVCKDFRQICIRRVMSFDNESDTLNIFCQNPGTFYRPIDYINYSGYNSGFSLNAQVVPSGCTSIIQGNNYSWASYLDFSCEGTYEFLATIGTNVGNGVICRDTVLWVINVATLQEPNAGTDSYIKFCDNDTVPLVGSSPIDINGNVNPYVVKLWDQVDTNAAVTFLGSANSQTVNVTGFQVGTYYFEYSFSRDSNCYLADTMMVVVEPCDSVPPPCDTFNILNCCELANSRSMVDEQILLILQDYKENMVTSNEGDEIDPCCNPCNFPNDSFPIFIVDDNNELIDASLYTISWSNDPSNHDAFGFTYVNEEVIVTVTSLIDSCSWQDTFNVQCCYDSVQIVPFCSWDPCDSAYAHIPFPLHVEDGDGNTLSNPDYTFLWSNGFGGNATSATLNSLPISVDVTDAEDGCVYSDTFDLVCCDPVTPEGLYCKYSDQNMALVWTPVADVIGYVVEITYNDPECCGENAGTMFTVTVETEDNYYILPADVDCFSWSVRSVCEDGDMSNWSKKACSCKPVCEVKAPIELACKFSLDGQTLSWAPVTNAAYYEIQFTYNDPKCCKGGTPVVSLPIEVKGTSYTIKTKKCFSWKVRAVCKDGTRSDWSVTRCSCGPVILNPFELAAKAVPNPAKNQVVFKIFHESDPSVGGIADLVIYDAYGLEMVNTKVNINDQVRVDLSTFKPGMYMYRLMYNGEAAYTDKLIVQ